MRTLDMGIITGMKKISTTSDKPHKTREKWMKKLLTGIALAGLIVFTQAQALAETTLDFIDFKKLGDNRVEIRLALSGEAPQTEDFTSENPARISLDLPGVSNNLPWNLPLPVDTGAAKDIKAVQASGRTRVTINVDKLVDYDIRTEGKNLYITLAADTTNNVATVDTPAPAPAAKRKPADTPPANSNLLSLNDISFTSLPGDSVQVRLTFNGPAVKPGSFTIDHPARVVLDFPQTASNLNWKNKNIGIGFAKSVTAVEAGNRTRVILNLVQLIPFESEVSGNDVVLTIAGSRAAASTTSSRESTSKASRAASLHHIKNIDFRRGAQGEGRIIVSLSDQNIPVSTGESGRQIFVEFADSSLAKNLQQRLDVIDFATPVQYIDASQIDGRVRLAISASGDYEYLAYHAGNTYTIEVKEVPKEKAAAKKKDEFGYTGEKLSLNFQDIEVRAVLQLIADFTGLNMVTSDSVRGSLTLRLKNVPWDQALDIILKTKGLAMRKAGNVILVAPSQEIAAQERLELEAQKQVEELAPLKTDIIQINYAKAAEIAELLRSKGGLLSERGEVAIDQRTNVLLISDTVDRLEAVRNLITSLDIPIRQVLIESRIVIATDDFAKNLGVRFGVTDVSKTGDNLLMTSGSANATDVMVASAMSNRANTGSPYPIDVPTGTAGIDQRMNVNFPIAASNAGRIAFSLLGANTLLDLELSALQQEGRGEVVSNPRVITANRKEAVIEQGTEIPYQQASSSGATNISFKKAVLSLRVTPQITPDDRIILDLKVTKDSVGQIFAGVPSIDTKQVETQVLMNNGETVVLGGVYETTNKEQRDGIPLLGDLPFIGVLFRSTLEQSTKKELLIFVTPKIVKEEFSTR
ncbi:MAG: type IV pilus secretin PilQ [Gammaproteobacteria bacterium]|nr:type IV pilus secretin PilQ [Gammaproteobacteria bacterium]